MELISILVIFFSSFGFRYLRELEDRILQGRDENTTFLKKRPGEPNESWYAKYAFPLQPFTANWMYLWLIKPKHKERFPYSTTLGVFITDKEHRLQFIQSVLILIIAGFSNFVIYYYGVITVLFGFFVGQFLKEVKKLDENGCKKG